MRSTLNSELGGRELNWNTISHHFGALYLYLHPPRFFTGSISTLFLTLYLFFIHTLLLMGQLFYMCEWILRYRQKWARSDYERASAIKTAEDNTRVIAQLDLQVQIAVTPIAAIASLSRHQPRCPPALHFYRCLANNLIAFRPTPPPWSTHEGKGFQFLVSIFYYLHLNTTSALTVDLHSNTFTFLFYV